MVASPKTHADVLAAVTRSKSIPCAECGADVWHINMGVCEVCFTIAYLHFRHAFNWPLDDNDKKRLGLA